LSVVRVGERTGVVVEVVSLAVGVVVVSVVDVGVVSVVVGVVSVVVCVPVSVELDEETVAVSVESELDVAPPPIVSPKATAARNPSTNRATIATAAHDFFRGPPFFASGAM
jgi:hypothetical protein